MQAFQKSMGARNTMKYVYLGATLIVITALAFGTVDPSFAQDDTAAQIQSQTPKNPKLSIHGVIQAISGNSLMVDGVLVTLIDNAQLGEIIVGNEVTLRGYLMPDDSFQATHVRL